MIDIQKEEQCCGCEACSNICPKKCIDMVQHNSFYYPKVNKNDCIDCHLCEKVCPVIHHEKKIDLPKFAVAGYNKDDKTRYNSTSGGAFYLLAKSVIEEGGLAYGVVFDNKFQTKFIKAKTLDELKLLQGSKYPQSRVNNIFIEIKKDLQTGKLVIFCGTPCQVYGLFNYLRGKTDNLILVDLICHGVPSPSIWEMYLASFFRYEKIKRIIFKDKRSGWKKWRVVIETNKRIYSAERLQDVYMSSYLGGYNVRPHCYECVFKGLTRVSDITIADAWGVPEKNKNLNDDQGLSAVISNSDKGYRCIENIKDEFLFEEYKFEDLVKGNKAYFESIDCSIFRDLFMWFVKHNKSIFAFKLFSLNNFSGKVILRISKILRKRG